MAELKLEAGGEGFSGSTQIVLVAGLPAVTVGRRQVQLSGCYAVNPTNCGALEHEGSHFRIKLPKRAAAAAAAAIQDAVLRGLVTLRWVPGCLLGCSRFRCPGIHTMACLHLPTPSSQSGAS